MNRAAIVAACAAAICACHAEVPRASEGRVNAVPVLHEGPLTDFVPAAGLRWLVAGSPAYFEERAPLREALARLFPSQRLDAFARVSGVDLRRTERAVVAAFDVGTLYLADGHGWVSAPEQRFVERAAGSARSERPHPKLWRETALIAKEPQALLRVADAFIAVAVDDPRLVRVVEAYALGQLKRTPSALRGAALSTLPRELLAPAPLAAYALGPFDAEWAKAAEGLLEGALALGVRFELEQSSSSEEVVALTLAVSGTWDELESPRHLLSVWNNLAHSELGRLLALDEPATEPRANASVNVLWLHLRMPLKPLAAGLTAVVAGSVKELLDGPQGASGAPRAPM